MTKTEDVSGLRPVAKFNVAADGKYALIFVNEEVRNQHLKPGAEFYTADQLHEAQVRVLMKAVALVDARAEKILRSMADEIEKGMEG